MHELRQVLHVLDRRMWQNAVAKIKDVPGPPGGEPKNTLSAPLYFAPRREERDGIEVTLHGMTVADGAPALVERNAPVEANDFSSGLRHRRQQRGAVRAEVD